MSSRQKLLSVLRGETVSPPPVWLMRQAGRYLPEYRRIREEAGSFLDLCFSPKLAAEVTLQPVRRFGLDAAILFADILLVPWALGQELAFVEGEGPLLTPRMDRKGLGKLAGEEAAGRLEPVFETVGRVRESLPDEVSVIGFCGGPWTVATYMAEGGASVEHLAARLWSYRDEDGFGLLIEKLVAVSAEYLVGQAKAGADCLMIFDSWAGILPEQGFDRWVVEPTRALIDRVRAAVPGVPIIGFPRGAGLGYKRYCERTGVDGVGLDPAVPLEYARDVLQERVAVQGNVDPAVLLASRERIVETVRHTLDVLGKKRYICNLGHGIHKDTPVENVAAYVKAARDW